MNKFFNKARMFAFIITVLSTIPLFIKYLTNAELENQLILHLHVWFGLIFIILAMLAMFLDKKPKK
jgi:hypothetical protein